MTVQQYIHTPGHSPVKVWTDEIEDSARKQLENIATLPFIYKHVAVMPDVHAGIGSTVGAVIPTDKAIVPAAIGVDIGCGMMAQRLALTANDLPDNLSGVRAAIESAVPHGRTDNGGANDRGAWGESPGHVKKAFDAMASMQACDMFEDVYPNIAKAFDRADRQLGTLGTGNHFIEVCLDDSGYVWVMLHSGSRGVGNKIGQTFIELAKSQMDLYHIKLADKDLAFLPESTDLFDDYMFAVEWAQQYALVNRQLMMQAVMEALEVTFQRPMIPTMGAVNCHHNYVARENHFGKNILVTRKGAVRARLGDMGIIPGSMGARSFIVKGKGNVESFCSCSHGAGRRMSRMEAKRRFTSLDLIQQTMGIECRKDADVVDEIPAAYKDIDRVMTLQSDLVDVVAILNQVVCVKG